MTTKTLSSSEDVYKAALNTYITKRVEFVVADARTYVFVRLNGYLRNNNMGGGNFATAYAQFALLNMLSKVNYYLQDPSYFTSSKEVEEIQKLKREVLSKFEGSTRVLLNKYIRVPRLTETNEEKAFIHFVESMGSEGVELCLPKSTSTSLRNDASTIWKGFRNTLSHVATVQEGKGIKTFTFEQYWDWQENSEMPLSIDDIMQRLRHKANTERTFKFSDRTQGWIMNVDVLTALLDELMAITIRRVNRSTLASEQLKLLCSLVQPT